MNKVDNKYLVYDGDMFIGKMNADEITRLTGISKKHIPRYKAKTGKRYGGKYFFERIYQGERPKDIDRESVLEDWDLIRYRVRYGLKHTPEWKRRKVVKDLRQKWRKELSEGKYAYR